MKQSLASVEREFQSYQCAKCSHAKKELVLLHPDDLHLKVGNKARTKIAVYKISCGISSTASSNMSLNCIHGDDKVVKNCSTCWYGKPVYLDIDIKSLQHRITKEEYSQLSNCRVTRVVYRCSNRSCAEHSVKEVLMSSYISCENYRNKGNAGHGKD